MWRAEVVGGLPGERFALIVVVHHVAADGLTGVALAGSLLDRTPDAAALGRAGPGGTSAAVARDLIRDRLRGLAAALRRARPFSGAGVRRLRALARQFRDASADLRTRTSETSLPRQVGPTRRLAVVRRAARRAAAGRPRAGRHRERPAARLRQPAACGRCCRARGDDVDVLPLRTSVPAATGAGHQASGIMLVDLPVGEPDPLRRLAAIHATTAPAKRRLYAGAGDVTDVLHLPIPLARVGMRVDAPLRRHPGQPVRDRRPGAGGAALAGRRPAARGRAGRAAGAARGSRRRGAVLRR